MSELTLVIGNKKYSSWSLRPWILLKQAKITFNEIRIPLFLEKSKSEILKYSKAGKVPILIDEDLTVWESLSICEYIAEKFPQKNLWPKNTKAKAVARSVSHEMHGGFIKLRKEMPMNTRIAGPIKDLSKDAQNDIDRICQIWNECRFHFGKGGPFLFGEFSIADCMYAPVALRFRCYQTELDNISETYKQAILNLSAFKSWIQDGDAEKEIIQENEKNV